MTYVYLHNRTHENLKNEKTKLKKDLITNEHYLSSTNEHYLSYVTEHTHLLTAQKDNLPKPERFSSP